MDDYCTMTHTTTQIDEQCMSEGYQTPDNQTMSKCDCADKTLNFIAELRGCTEEPLTYLNGYEKRFYVKHVCKEMEEIEEAIVEFPF